MKCPCEIYNKNVQIIYKNGKIKAATAVVLILLFCFSSEHLLCLKIIDDLEYFVQSMRTDFNIIAISDSNHSKINSNQMTLLPNYRYEFCPTVTNTGGTMIYIRNHLIYKVRSS